MVTEPLLHPASPKEIVRSRPVHIPALDGVRGLAVLIVVMLHYLGGAQNHNPFVRAFGYTLRAGWSGVSLFFVLSGFLITGILWDTRHQSLKRFFLRRTVRIFPLYYFALMLVAISLLIVKAGWHQWHDWLIFLAYGRNIQPLLYNLGIGGPLHVDHFWSLACEEQFYIVWPFLIRRCRNLHQAKWLAAGMIVVSFAMRWMVLYGGWSGMAEFTLSRAGELAVGAFLALVIRESGESPQWLKRLAWPVFLTAFAVFFAIAWTHRDPRLSVPAIYLWGIVAISMMYGAMLVLALESKPVKRLFELRFLRYLGTISYGVYVYHILFIKQFRWAGAKITGQSANQPKAILVTFVIAVLGTWIVSALSFRYFESPILKLKDRWAPQKRVQMVPPSFN